MYVALKRGYSNLGFNGLDTNKLFFKEEIEFMRKYQENLKNYCNRYDLKGNFMGDEINKAIYAIL